MWYRLRFATKILFAVETMDLPDSVREVHRSISIRLWEERMWLESHVNVAWPASYEQMSEYFVLFGWNAECYRYDLVPRFDKTVPKDSLDICRQGWNVGSFDPLKSSFD
jgi:hypothetical protein